MRTITELLRMDGRIYVYLPNETIRKKFLLAAEAEGFTFHNGTLPTKGPEDDIYRIAPERKMNTVGWAGHMAFHNPSAVVGGLIRVDYEKYVLEFDDYIL